MQLYYCNRTHKTTLGGMGASVSQAHETLYYLQSRLSLIVRVNVVLNRTVAVDSD